MKKPKKTGENEFFLDMPFEEAMERYAGTSPQETEEAINRSKKKKPPGGKHKPPDKTGVSEKVVSLRDTRNRKRNHG